MLGTFCGWRSTKSNPVLGRKHFGTLAVVVILPHCQEGDLYRSPCLSLANKTSSSVVHARAKCTPDSFLVYASLWKQGMTTSAQEAHADELYPTEQESQGLNSSSSSLEQSSTTWSRAALNIQSKTDGFSISNSCWQNNNNNLFNFKHWFSRRTKKLKSWQD